MLIRLIGVGSMLRFKGGVVGGGVIVGGKRGIGGEGRGIGGVERGEGRVEE